MKIKSNYVLQKIVDEYLVIPIGEEADKLHGVIKLSETGALLWDYLETGVNSMKELEDIIIAEYDVDPSKVHDDIETYLNQLKTIGCIEC